MTFFLFDFYVTGGRSSRWSQHNIDMHEDNARTNALDGLAGSTINKHLEDTAN